MMETKTQVGTPQPQVAVVKTTPGFFAQVLGPFKRREFWVGLIEAIVQASIAAFMMAVGSAIARYGEKKSTLDTSTLFGERTQSPAAQAFSNQQSFSRGYTPTTSYGGPLQNPPATIPPDGSWPGFGVTR